MNGIFVYSEDIAVTKQLLNIGRSLADVLQVNVTALALNETETDTAGLIACGAEKVIALSGSNPWVESYAESIAECIAKENPLLVLIGGTMRGKDVAARIAAWHSHGLVNSAMSIEVVERKLETKRMLYGGLAVCTEELSEGCIVTIDPRTYEEAAADPLRSGDVVACTAQSNDAVLVGGVCPIVRERADLANAEKIICVGRGLSSQSDMKLVEDLAEKIGAEIGCSRSIAEDYHWLPTESYIGLSGQKVKPQLYLSIGISGQVQHIVGARDARIIVAIDKNEKAPIFSAADYGIVGDLYEIVPKLIEKLGK
ncbi:electron transfer flavoprotein subunit alpha/FixB family protein [Propionispira raffinosivorans]|uniref:electron transfer flavoprotein subunit alpha/FixB family protein n=1 Tax=Propionispira raffinosivorans TaxID=86959 RepID=UPI00036B492F|nr:electron transfer flavoprotein subunit alpha/FixB family protein [Propionispira raffinosivorans]